jgi:ribosomal protein L19
MPDDPDREILIELHRIGSAMEVRAVSAGDGLEVVFAAPASASNHDVDQLARAKLAYVRKKSGPASGDNRGGLIV